MKMTDWDHGLLPGLDNRARAAAVPESCVEARTGSAAKALALGALLAAGFAVAGCGPLSAGAATTPPTASAPASTTPPAGQPTASAQPSGQQTSGGTALPQWNVCYPNGTGSSAGCPPLMQGVRAYDPAVMVPDEDGSGVFRDLHWTSWTSTSATATGTAWVNNCIPNCATGSVIPYAARVTLDEPVSYGGQLYFNRLTTYFPDQTPTGRHTEIQTPLTGP